MKRLTDGIKELAWELFNLVFVDGLHTDNKSSRQLPLPIAILMLLLALGVIILLIIGTVGFISSFF